MRKWSQILQHDISLLDWESIWVSTSKISRCVSHKETAYKIIMFWYRTPALLHACNPTISRQCWRCNNAVGSHYHIFWECPSVCQFWTQIQTLLGTPILLKPIHYQFGLPFPGIPKAKRRLMLFTLLAAKLAIPSLWLSTSPPTFPQFLTILADIHRMEHLTALVELSLQKFSKVWQIWDESEYCSEVEDPS